MQTFDVIIYHNARCSTSRTVLDFIRINGYEPHVIEYLKTPPTPAMLRLLAARADVPLRSFLREKEAAYKKLRLDDSALDDEYLADVMHKHPELINRPIVVSPQGVRLCRPAEAVSELLLPLDQV